MSLKSNQVVSINYTLKDEDGNVIQATDKENPFSFISGQGQILPKLEEQLDGMLIGSKKEVTLSAEEAYGNYQEEAIQNVKRTDFPEGTDLQKGMGFVANTPDGRQMPFTISEIKEDDITIDFNHPLAGKALTFDVELLNVREATNEELEHGHVHGAGGHQH